MTVKKTHKAAHRVVEKLLLELPPANVEAEPGDDHHVRKLETACRSLSSLVHLIEHDFNISRLLKSLNAHYEHPEEGDGRKRIVHYVGRPGITQWQNWGESVAWRELQLPNSNAPPCTAEQVSEVVQRAVREGKKVRCVGHGHTWTPAFFDGGDSTVVIFSSNLKTVYGHNSPIVLVSRASKVGRIPARVRLAAGVTTRELADWFEQNAERIGHVGLPTDVILDNVQYGGVISMACHGTGRNARPLADYVKGVTLVDATGSIRTFDDEHDPDLRQFLCAAFGMTGVIIDLTLELDDKLELPYVRVQHSFPQMDVLFGNANDASALKALVEGNEAVELFWMPFGSINLLELATSRSSTLLRSWDPYKDNMWQNIFVERVAPPTDPATKVVHYGFEEDGQSRLIRERVETQLGGFINLLSNKMEARQQSSILPFSRRSSAALRVQMLAGVMASELLKREAAWSFGTLRSGILTLPKAIHYKSYIDDFRVFDFEVCFPVAADFSNVHQAWRAVVDLASKWIRKEKYNPLNLAMEVRFTKGSTTAVLSPAYSPGNPSQLFVWIEVLCGAGTPVDTWLDFVEQVHKEWCERITHPGNVQPKLHWAKWTDIGEAKRMGARASRADWITPYVKRVCQAELSAFRGFLNRFAGGASGRDANPYTNEWLRKIVYED